VAKPYLTGNMVFFNRDVNASLSYITGKTAKGRLTGKNVFSISGEGWDRDP